MSTTISPQGITDWHDLLAAVEETDGIYRVPVETLRRLEGRQRVGKHILSSIEEKLATLGLGHLPTELPNRQQQKVLLYRVGTPASEVVKAVQDGLTNSPSNEAFDFLRRLNTLPDPEDVVSREEIAGDVQGATEAVLSLLRRVKPEGKGNVLDITSILDGPR